MIETINDTTININLIKVISMALLWPLLKDEFEYKQRFAKYKGRQNRRSFTISQDNGLEKRVKQLEARQVLLEADLTLLEAQLELEKVKV